MTEQRFRIEMDNQVFRLPWSTPSFFQIKLWFEDLMSSFDSWEEYRLLLSGGSWAWSPVPSGDLDVFLVPKTDVIDLEDIQSLRRAHQIMLTGFDLAFNRHRFLLDFTLSESRRLFSIYENFLDFESGRRTQITNPRNVTTGYQTFRIRRKFWNNELESEHVAAFTRDICLGDERHLYEKPVMPLLTKQSDYIREGRVYHAPIFLDELFDV